MIESIMEKMIGTFRCLLRLEEVMEKEDDERRKAEEE